MFFLRVFFWVLVLIIVCSEATIGLAQQRDSTSSGDPNAFRLLLAPTSVGLPANHGSIQLAELSVPCINYGIIDELIVRGGIAPFTIDGHLLYFTMAGLEVFNYSGFSGLGGLAITSMTGSGRSWESSLYGFGVLGYTSPGIGIYGGFGGGYSASRESNSAIVMLGAVLPVSSHNAVVTENWIIPESGTEAVSLGVRIWGKVLSGDFGIIAITREHSLQFQTVAPWVSLSYHFDASDE